MKQGKTKILIVKIGAIGDAVMSLSMINEIDKKYPGSEITWLCGNIISPLISSIPRINNVVPLNEKKLLTGTKFEQAKVLFKVWIKFFLNAVITTANKGVNTFNEILKLKNEVSGKIVH